MVQRSSVKASSVLVFKKVCQRTNFSQITYKASSGMVGEMMHVVFWADWIGTLAYIDVQWEKLLKSTSLKRRDPQLIDLCLGSFMLFLSGFCYAYVRV